MRSYTEFNILFTVKALDGLTSQPICDLFHSYLVPRSLVILSSTPHSSKVMAEVKVDRDFSLVPFDIDMIAVRC